MKNYVNRFLALMLCLSFVCSLIPVMAKTPDDLLRFQVENGEATLIGTDFELSGDVVIPADYQGCPVTAIAAYAFSEEISVRSVTIPHTVTSIHREAFMCDSLEAFYVENGSTAYSSDNRGVLYNKDKTVLVRAPLQLSGSYTVPTGVTAIGEYAFHLCFGVTEIILPEGLTHIGQRAFDACNNLKTLHLPESVFDIGIYAFSGCSKLPYTVYDNAKYLGSAENPYRTLILAVNEDITAAKVHADTKIIAGAAFRQCYVMTEITVPEGVHSIGTWAFYGCSALKNLQLPSTLRFIGDDAFAESGLTEIAIPEGVRHISSGAFQGCEALTAVTLPESLTNIGEKAFAETALTEIRLAKNVTRIGEAAFYDCPALTGIWVSEDNAHYSSDDRGVLLNKDQTVLLCAPRLLSGSYQIPNGVTKIDTYAFYRCQELTEVTLPDSLTCIGTYAFYNCWHLTTMDIPEGVTFLGEYAFAACNDLDTVTVPKSITELPTGLFYHAYCIQTVSLPQGLTKIGNDAFNGCEYLTDIQIPDSVTSIGENAFRGCYTLQTVIIPEGVAEIGRSAFQGCNGLIRVSIPNSILRVGSQAFSNCRKLTYNYTSGSTGKYLGNEEVPCLVFIGVNDDEVSRVTLDNDTRVIADSALASCCELSSITLPDGLLTIGSKSFYCCESLRNLTIPTTVTYIGESAFERCRFAEIIIPASVQEIGVDCFSNCSKLITVRFCGIIPQIGWYAFEGVTATAYCHFEGNEDRMKHYGGSLTWAEGHVFLNYQPDDGYHCTTGGTKTAKCEGCDATDTLTVTETAEHQFERGVCTICGAIDPNGCSLTGTLTGIFESNTVLTLQQNDEAVSTLTVTGNTYLWEQLQPGEYTLTVEKADHVTYRTELTVIPGENTLDLTLCRPGDVVGLGDLNMGDVASIYAHIRGRSILTDYAKDCADVTGDGKINVGDTARLYSKIRGK